MGRIFGKSAVISLSAVAVCISISCFEKKATDPSDSGRPEEPSNPSPADGATGQPLSLTLSWSCDDPDGDPLTYDIYFGSSAVPTLQAENHHYPQYQVASLSGSTTYFWRIVAKDDRGNRSNGGIWSFRTEEGGDGGGTDEWGEAERLFGGFMEPSITADGRTMYMTDLEKIYVSSKASGVWLSPVPLPYPVNDTAEINFIFSPSISGDGNTLYFSRLAFILGYLYSRKVGNIWQEPRRVDIDTTNLILEDILCISWDGSTLWFSALQHGSQNLDIYSCTYNGSSWSPPLPFSAVNTAEYNETGMAISGNGNTFYFTSEGRPEVPLSRSIWVTHKVYGTWQTPVPLGETINMPDFDQVSSPAISYDGSQLFFRASRFPWPSGIYVSNALR